LGRTKKIKFDEVKFDPEPVMKNPCCDRAWITYPHLNPTYCVNCGALRVKIPKGIERIKKAKKPKRVEKPKVDRYGDSS
jgi:hypothetical protein